MTITLDPTAWIEAITDAPPATLDTEDDHTYSYQRSKKVVIVEVRNSAQPTTKSIDAAEVEIWTYPTATSLPTWEGRAHVTITTGPTRARFLIPYSVGHIYIRQSEDVNSQGATATDPNPPYEYRVIYDNKTLVVS